MAVTDYAPLLFRACCMCGLNGQPTDRQSAQQQVREHRRECDHPPRDADVFEVQA